MPADHFKRSILNTIETDDQGNPMPGQSSPMGMPEPDFNFAPLSVSNAPLPQRPAASPSYGADNLMAQLDTSSMMMQEPMSFGGGGGGGAALGGMPAAGSPSDAAQVDGKEFFKRARHRLSFQQFNEFLANIKKLNSHVQTRDQTLDIANGIFGPENQDLHVAFTQLLSRHGV